MLIEVLENTIGENTIGENTIGENTIGEKKIKKIINKKRSALYDYKINSIYTIFKLNIRFNIG